MKYILQDEMEDSIRAILCSLLKNLYITEVFLNSIFYFNRLEIKM